MLLWKFSKILRSIKKKNFISITLHACMHACLLAQLCLTLWDPMDCSPPGSSVHGVFLASISEWVAIPFSRGSS